jgi:hypothetical protein
LLQPGLSKLGNSAPGTVFSKRTSCSISAPLSGALKQAIERTCYRFK